MNASLCACCERRCGLWPCSHCSGGDWQCQGQCLNDVPFSHILSSKLSDSSSVSLLYLEPHTPGPKQRQLTRQPCLPARTLISPEQWPENCPPTSINQVSHHPRTHSLSLMHAHTFSTPFHPSLITPFVSLSLCLGQVSLFCLPVKQRKREQMQLQMRCEGEEYHLHKLSTASLCPTRTAFNACKLFKKTSGSRVVCVTVLLDNISFLS